MTGHLGDIRRLLKVDVQKAKAELEKHVTGIRMVPQMEGKKGHYVAEGEPVGRLQTYRANSGCRNSRFVLYDLNPCVHFGALFVRSPSHLSIKRPVSTSRNS